MQVAQRIAYAGVACLLIFSAFNSLIPASEQRSGVPASHDEQNLSALQRPRAQVTDTPVQHLAGRTDSPSPGHPTYQCNSHENTEYWGDVVMWGHDHKIPTAEGCCSACQQYEPTIDVLKGAQCNIWVWHPELHECWLKYIPDVSQPAVQSKGPQTPWTSGTWLGVRECADCKTPEHFVGCISRSECNTSRVCGSPAVDAYAHVDAACLEQSPTAVRYLQLVGEGVELQGHLEEGWDLDGLAVHWGIGHKQATAKDCEAACRRFKPSPMDEARTAPFSRLPCNTWTWCGEEECWEPDAHHHTRGDCWLKFTELPETPEVNMRLPMLPRYVKRHSRELSRGVPWTAGVLVEPGVKVTNGTWGPRAYW